MDEQPANPSSATAPTWSITKSEWDGFSSRAQKLQTWTWVSVGMTVLFGVLMLVSTLFTPEVPGTTIVDTVDRVLLIAGGVVILLALPEYLWLQRSSRKWDTLHAEVWEANGCACPWCRERVDAVPCRRHGFTRAEQELLLRYWESAATKDMAGLSRYGGELLARQRHKTTLARVRGSFATLVQSYLFRTGDPEATPLLRLRAALPSIFTQYSIIALLGFLVWYFFGRSMLLSALAGCWWFVLFIPISVMLGPFWKVGKLRCAKCGQLCASSRPTLCPECGSDLTLPAAVSRTERSGGSWRAAIYFLPMILIIAGNPLIKWVASSLPASVQSSIYTWTGPPYGYFQNMSVATMTQAEIDGALEVLISCSAPDGPRPIFDYDFMKKAMAAGKAPDATVERSARTVVQARLEVARDGGAVVGTVTPLFGALIFGMERTPRLVFGGVSVDGETWTNGAAWSLFAHDLEEFWRKNSQFPPLPESKLKFIGRIDGLPRGPHTVRARCWIVVYGPSWQRFTPAFDENGVLIPPAGALVYPLDLTTTIEIK